MDADILNRDQYWLASPLKFPHLVQQHTCPRIRKISRKVARAFCLRFPQVMDKARRAIQLPKPAPLWVLPFARCIDYSSRHVRSSPQSFLRQLLPNGLVVVLGIVAFAFFPVAN